jgi:ADP-heptose:LPS heptosyltransferase
VGLKTSQNPEKILLVRAGRGGDLIMITPAINALLEAYPWAEFHLLTTGDGRRILGDFDPRIARTFLYSRRFPRTLVLQRRLTTQFRAEGYRRIFIFETKPHYRQWLGGLAPEVHVLTGTADNGHYSARCLDLVAGAVEGEVSRGWASLSCTADGVDQARQLLADHGVDSDARLVALHPTFSGTGLPLFRDRQGLRHRMWPGESFARLARLLVDRAGSRGEKLAVVIDALPEEVKYVQPIVEQSGGAITLLAAPPAFQRYKGFLSLLDVLVTPNTGPMHMAAALGTPLVALFSHWSPEDCGPYMDPARYLVLRAEETAQPELGLAAIAPESVAEAVEGLLR